MRRNYGSSEGSAKQVKVPSYTPDPLAHEQIEQMNKARYIARADRVGGASGSSYYQLIGVWDFDVWIDYANIINRQSNALSSATTDIFLKAAPDGEFDFEGGTFTGERTLFSAEGFNTGNFPAKSMRSTKEFADGTLGDAIGDDVRAFKLNAGEALFVEFVNAEGAARYIDVVVYYAAFDKIVLEPSGLENSPRLVQREFKRSARGND
jgi:hypothetical protein